MENVNLNEKVSPNKERRKSFVKVVNERVGKTVLQNCNELAFIVEYVNSQDVTIQFKRTGEIVKTTYNNFVKGEVKSHFTPTVYGVGITGVEPTTDEDGELIDSYKCWREMLRRCYSAKLQAKLQTYKDCYVCSNWLYYPNFKKWYDENYYEIEGKTLQLDKDILIKGNKIYSPDTCVFVPQFINKLFTKRQNNRGELPVGVDYLKASKKYRASLSVFNDGKKTRKHLGYFDTADEAFYVYKQAKENYIKDVADKYKDIIPVELYKAMYDYEVEIDD